MKGEIKFVSGGVEGTEVLCLSKEGIWANPDVPVDKAAGYVLEALDSYVKKLVNEAVKAERKACALIADEEFGSTLWIGDAQPKHSSAWRIAAAIRERGES